MAFGKEKIVVSVPAADFRTLSIPLLGTSPMAWHRFSKAQAGEMEEKQKAGSAGRGRKTRTAKDFDATYLATMYVAPEGWRGIPAMAIKNAMVSACRTVSLVMVTTKMAFWVNPDGFDRDDGRPLVRITKGDPSREDAVVRVASGATDIHPRARWDAGWEATVSLSYDAGMLQEVDVVNLLHRAGLQVGIGEGRMSSPKNCGIGYGSFVIRENEHTA